MVLRGVWFALLFTVAVSDVVDPVSYLWPMPQSVHCYSDQVYTLTEAFAFQGTGHGGNLPALMAAFERYRQFVTPSTVFTTPTSTLTVSANVTTLETLVVEVSSADDTLDLETDESYNIEFSDTTALLKATTVYGALRGIETFSQLVHQDDNGAYYIVACTISDKPRFQFRSILVDTSRHYIPLEVLQRHIEVMAFNKFNVLHWHIVDSQSFPYESYTFPDLSRKGAYDPNHVYTQLDVAALIDYAKQHGVRVIPEFDTPGHTLSWGLGQPDLLTPCYDKNAKPTGKYGPINPILESTYTFLQAFYREIINVFPDQYIHLGGDEVSFDCWASNPDIQKWMAENNYTSKEYSKLEQYYEQRLIDMAGGLGKSYIVWQEIFDNDVKIKDDTVISIWKRHQFSEELANVTAAGYKVILSACWYLNVISYGQDWMKYYECDPQDFTGTAVQKELVMGGGAAMWSEFVDSTNLLSRTWPRASAVGEKLWSAALQTTNASKAAPRLDNHRCRMLRRGIPAEPLAPSYCPEEYIPPMP